MPIPFKVTAVQDASEWGEPDRRLCTWTLECIRKDTGGVEKLQIRSKPTTKYHAGDEFFAEPTDKPPYKGMKTWKRVQAPQGGSTSSAPSGSGQTAPVAQARRLLEYALALEIARKV